MFLLPLGYGIALYSASVLREAGSAVGEVMAFPRQERVWIGVSDLAGAVFSSAVVLGSLRMNST